MAAPVKMLKKIPSVTDDDVDSDKDSSSSEDEFETSWGRIYKSLRLSTQSRENLNPEDIFHIANGAVLHGDFVSSIQLFSLGLRSIYKEWQQKAGSLGSEGEVKQVAVDKLMLKYALEGCAQDNEKLSSREMRRRVGKVLEVLDDIVKYCDVLSLMDANVLQAVASLYFSLQAKQKAFSFTARALHLNPKSLSLQEMLENICCHLVERWHFVMLNDKGRNRAYQQAIEAVLTQMNRKAIVCDVGCGTGLLSLIACQHLDSGRIFAIEKSNSMCEVAHSVFKANLGSAKSGKITLINKMSTQMSVPQHMPHRADLLVTETFDAGLFGEGILPTLCHAWSHLLKISPGEKGQVIPGRAQLYLQAVESDAILQESRFLGEFDGINTSGIHIYGCTGLCDMDPYAAHDLKQLPRGYRTLSKPLKFMDVDFNDPEELTRLNMGTIQKTDLEISSDGRLDAIAVWFSLHLNSCVEIRTHTDCKGCWDQAIFPVHPVKVEMQPLSRGQTCDLKVQAGDILKVDNGLSRTKLCMDVSAILKPHEASVSCNPPVPQFLHDPEVWQALSTYCLPCKDIKVLNNMFLNSSQHKRIQELFALVKKDNSEVEFIHLNDGFSPLCLQALQIGFGQASTWVHDQCEGALLRKLMTLNEIDTHKLKVIEDTSDGDSDRMSEYGFDTLPMSDTAASCGRAVVVVCDIVDTQGRITESLRCREEVLRHHLSCFVRSAVSPCRVDVYGILVDSEHLLTRSRVESDDNTLGFNIGQFINKYTTRNHQDISLETLPHTKLSEPFRMFTIDMYKLLGIPEPDTDAQLSTLIEEAPYPCPEKEQQGQKSSYSSFSKAESASLACLQPGHEEEESEIHKLNSESDHSSCGPTQRVAAGFASSAESENVSQDTCVTDPHLREASGCKAGRIHDCWKKQGVCHGNDASEIISCKCTKQELVNIGMLDTVPDTELDSECVAETERSMHKSISKQTSRISQLRGKAESSRLSVPECDAMRNKKRSSSCQLVDDDRAAGGSSPDRKRGRLARVDVDEGSDAFLDGDLNTENGELTQSVHLKVPIIQSGHVTALIYWFDLHLSPTCRVSTNDPSQHWNQAAVMSAPSQTHNVAAGDVSSLFCQMDGSAISFLIE